jgi:hypothetical protein
MKETRESIDRKLDELSFRTTAAKQNAVRLASAVAMFAGFTGVFLWWQRRHA